MTDRVPSLERHLRHATPGVDVLKTVFLVALLVGVPVATAVGGVAAAPNDLAAELVVDQPHYVDEPVRQTNADGNRVYIAHAAALELRPTNFDADDVTSFGVSTEGGSLSYDDQTGEYVFEALQTGTYTLYFTVASGSGAQAGENASNASNASGPQRYVANVRVEGGTNLVHVQQSDLDAQQADAQKWQDWNASVQQVRDDDMLVDLGLSEPPGAEEVHQVMLNRYVLVGDPLQALFSGTTGVFVVLFLSVSGLLVVLVGTAYHTAIIAFLYGKLNRYESAESDEGEISDRIIALDREESARKLAKRDFSDVFGDPWVAEAMRDLGDNPLQALTKLMTTFRDRLVVHNRLQAMGQAGYVAVIDERAATDGGEDHDDTDGASGVVSAHVAHEGDLPDDHDLDVVPLSAIEEPDDELMDALDWSQDAIYDFDYVDADFDRSDLPVTPLNTDADADDMDDLEHLLEMTDIDLRNFSDSGAAAKYVRELLVDVREHPITDDRSEVDTLRYGLEHLLDSAHLMRDRYEMPVQYLIDRWDRALEEHDPAARATQTLQDVQEGKYA